MGDRRKPSLCRALTVLIKQSKLITGEDEQQPYTRLSRILVRMWALTFPGKISSSPDHLCWKSGWAVIQQVLKPTDVPISNCFGNAFRKRHRQTIAEGLNFWGHKCCGDHKAGTVAEHRLATASCGGSQNSHSFWAKGNGCICKMLVFMFFKNKNI